MHHRSYYCVELEILAIRSLGDVQVSQEKALYGGSQHVFDCVDGVSEQGKEMSERTLVHVMADQDGLAGVFVADIFVSCHSSV